MSYYLLRNGNETQIKNLFSLKHLYETSEADAGDVVRKDGRNGYRTVGDMLGMSYGFAADRSWQRSFPSPPPVPWWVTLIFGALTFGYGLSVVGVVQAFWSRKVERRWSPVVLAVLSALTPPVHLVWMIRSVMFTRHSLREAALDLFLGLIAAEIAAATLTTMASLSIRRSLTRKFEESGFRMNWLLTALFSTVYTAYAIEDFSNSYK